MSNLSSFSVPDSIPESLGESFRRRFKGFRGFKRPVAGKRPGLLAILTDCTGTGVILNPWLLSTLKPRRSSSLEVDPELARLL